MTTVGSSIRLSGRFYDPTGNPADPTTVTCTVTLPDGTTTASPATTQDSVGVWHADYAPATVGLYQYYFTGTGSNAQVTPPDVFNTTAPTTTALVSLEAVKNFLQMGTSTDRAVDARLLSFIQSASAAVNAYAGYTMPATFTEHPVVQIDGSGHRVLVLARTPLLSVTSVTPIMQGLPTIDISTLVMNKEAGIIYLGNWWSFYGPQEVVYKAGRATVPPQVRDAVLILVEWMWETQRGGAVAVPGMGGEDISMLSGMPGFPTRALALLSEGDLYAAPGLA